MPILFYTAALHWLISGALVIAALATDDFWILAIAFSVAIVGVLFFALEKILCLLSDIRDALTEKTDGNPPTEEARPGSVSSDTVLPEKW